MKNARMLAVAIVLGLFAAPAAQAAVVLESGSYGPGDTGFVAGNVNLGPGRYHFTLDFSGPLDFLDGSITKQTVTDEFCDFGNGEVPCGGDDVPTIPLFEPTTPNRYEAAMTVHAPFEVLTPGQIIVRSATFDICCTYDFAFGAPDAGQYLLSYQAVPEPASWMLMIAGVGLAGAALRRRRQGQPQLA